MFVMFSQVGREGGGERVLGVGLRDGGNGGGEVLCGV